MKIFVFSDSHLNAKYDEEFFKWVQYWTKDADKIIICGDFWDKYVCSRDKFLDSRWREELFPLLKSKNTHYIYGNHDEEVDQDEGVNQFSTSQSLELDMDLNGKTFHFEHGDRFGTPFDTSWWPFLVRIGYWIQKIMVGIIGVSFFKIFKHQVDDIESVWGKNDKFLVCGHTHYGAEGENYYILNPSAFGLEYGLIIDEGKLTRVKGYEQIKKRE